MPFIPFGKNLVGVQMASNHYFLGLEPPAEQLRHAQHVVIVGAGPSGCEMAGAVSELMRWALNNAFKQLDHQKTRIVLVDPGDRVLRAMPAELSKAALKGL